jgi:hypothetical protein
MTLLMVGRHPEVWAAASAWVGISDLAAWHERHAKDHYGAMLRKSCGGAPGDSPDVDRQYQERSPIAHLHRAKDVPLDIGTGVHDGRTGSVPFRHTLQAFNAVAAPGDRLAPADIESYYATERLPAGWSPAGADLLYGKKKPLFRWISGNTRVTIFEGGHEIVHVAGLNWLAQQRKGQPAVWDIKDPVQLKIPAEATRSGK